MPKDKDYRLPDDPFIEELFFREWPQLVRYVYITLKKRGCHLDPIGRAEEIVQETFYLASTEKREDLLKSEDQHGWLVSAVSNKMKEGMRADRKWVRNLKLLPSEELSVPFEGPDEMAELFEKEDYELLRRLYVEGYTYREVCEMLEISKSNLGTKLWRIKKRFRDNHEKIFK